MTDTPGRAATLRSLRGLYAGLTAVLADNPGALTASEMADMLALLRRMGEVLSTAAPATSLTWADRRLSELMAGLDPRETHRVRAAGNDDDDDDLIATE